MVGATLRWVAREKEVASARCIIIGGGSGGGASSSYNTETGDLVFHGSFGYGGSSIGGAGGGGSRSINNNASEGECASGGSPE